MLPVFLSLLTSEDDRTRFTKLYREYREQLVNTAERLLYNKTHCEDCAEDAFLYLAQHFERISRYSDDRIGAYLYTVVRTRAYAANEHDKHSVFSLDECSDAAPADDSFTAAFLAEEVTDAVQRLPDGYRELFLLHYLHGYTVQELSRDFGMKLSTVYKRLARARAELRRLLGMDGGDDE